MNLQDKRMDAAHTLVVPYDATPEMVNKAYERRLVQRFNVNSSDKASYIRGMEHLYDAHVRMRFSPNRQILAEIKLSLTREADKVMSVFTTVLKCLRRDSDDISEQYILTTMIEELSKINIKQHVFEGVIAYDLAGLGSMMTYNIVFNGHSTIIPLIVYSSMLGASVSLGFMKESIRRHQEKIKVLGSVWKGIRKMRTTTQDFKTQKQEK